MYYLVKSIVPFLEKYSFFIAIFFFCLFIFQMKSKKFIINLQKKSQNEYNNKKSEMIAYNHLNGSHQLQVSSSWLDLYKYYLRKRFNLLLFSMIFAYISFNTTSYYESSTENFYKLLTISTTLFLAGLTYIQQRNK